MASPSKKSARKLQKQAWSLLERSEKLAESAEAEDDKDRKLDLLVRSQEAAELAKDISETAADLAPK